MEKKKSLKFGILGIVLCVILAIYSISMLLPILYGLWTSLKDNLAFTIDPVWFPKKPTFDNYKNAWDYFYVSVITDTYQTKVYLPQMFVNSLLYAVGCGFCQTFVPFLVAYLTARYKFALSKIINTLVVVVMMIPVVGSLPSEIQMAKTLGLFDTIWGVFIMQSNFLGMYYLVFYATFAAIPNDFVEAAEIDGANPLTIMFKIMFPMAITSFGAVFLLKFIYYWNEYQIALVYLPSFPTISKGLLNFDKATINEIANIPSKLAGCMMLCVPIFALFLIFKNKLMGNVSLGGVKG